MFKSDARVQGAGSVFTLSNWDCVVLPIVYWLRFCQRGDDFPLYSRRPSCDTLALAMCDPGLRRRHSSECEEDSLPEVYMDSGLSTLRGSHTGYDSEQEVKGQEEEEEEEERAETKREDNSHHNMMGEHSDTEVRQSVSQRYFCGSRWEFSDTDGMFVMKLKFVYEVHENANRITAYHIHESKSFCKNKKHHNHSSLFVCNK